MDNKTVAQRIRDFFRHLFGSRLVDRLETDLLYSRQDFERQLNDRDELIADLRQEIAQLRAKCETFETVLLPIASPAGSLFRPKPDLKSPTFQSFTEKSSWQKVQEDWYRQQAEEATAEQTAKEKSGEIGERKEIQQ